MLQGTLKSFDPSVDDFEVWKLMYHSYLAANGVDLVKETDKARGILLSSMGIQTCSLLMSLIAPAQPATTSLNTLLQTLTEHFKPAPKAIAERLKFMSRQQKPDESVSEFLAELRKVAITCKFSDLTERLRDQFIFGLTNESSQKKIFTLADDVKLDKVLSAALAQETAEKSTSLIRGGSQLDTPEPVLKSQVIHRSQPKTKKIQSNQKKTEPCQSEIQQLS